ncbi:hypothetical protein HMSSN036_82420 [Paenibacillus macerans]|nr:hypothetical protein HMSSN036_82420 [Paenibacillus macerans]
MRFLHAADLKGAAGPSLRGVGDKHSKEEIMSIIKEGYNGRMPAVYDTAIGAGVTDEELDHLAEWLAKQKRNSKIGSMRKPDR